ncbi:hypothetical protein CPB83DRAFT_844475 [Crepidotus variabilis]|uniref:Uncharacterized protein n=1 Tax=Crepidotus variabilis TaxID=179855 RepID=A0A9P6ERD8_9AGAR|nr:hypothetical protein CPB83DRAFT_844475 [Crepidotus variabilis]
MAESFQILCITAHSDQPIRNSSKELIYGSHTLWDINNSYVDDKGSKGSLAPNAFSYDFVSPLSKNSALHVTLKVINNELCGSDYILQGSQDDTTVFESEAFSITSAKEVTAAVHVTAPHISPGTLSFKGDFLWTLTPKGQQQASANVEYSSREKTGLELYWISKDIHEIFLAGLSGIDIEFLRSAILRFDFKDISKPQSKLLTPADATQRAFYSYSKVYDTTSGAPHFGVTYAGGVFNYTYYVSPAYPNGPAGGLQRIVNCYDQAAMVQVLATLGNTRPTWLFQQPNGWINTTALIGITQWCNNPFFSSNNTAPLVNINDPNRTRFGNHAFNGHPPNSTFIYDACGGPHLGTENPAQYVQSSIDAVTNLYAIQHTRPGTVADIQVMGGVTGVLATRLTRPADSTVSKGVSKFLQKCRISNTKQSSQTHWDDVGKWAKQVLGKNCDVAFHDTILGDGVVESLWHLKGAEGVDGDIVARVRVSTRIGQDGKLHYDHSSSAAFDDLAFALQDVELDLGPNAEKLDTLWAPAPFEEYAHHALQYGPEVAGGRFLVVSGNVMVDISGGPSSAALEPIVRKVLTHTTVDTPASLHIPKVTKQVYDIPQTNKGPSNEVKGLFTTFDVECQVDDLVVATRADVEGHGLLLSKYTVQGNKDAKTSTVIFTFVTRAVGTHNVDLRFEEGLTMNTSAKRIQITVLGG